MTYTAAFDTANSLRRGLVPCLRSGTDGASSMLAPALLKLMNRTCEDISCLGFIEC
jgi:hypothetical protein